MLLSLLLIFSGAIISPLVVKYFRKIPGYVLSVLPMYSYVTFLSFFNRVKQGTPAIKTYPWITSFDIHFTFYLDGLSLLFSLLISGIGILILIYSNGYMKSHHHTGRFYAYMLMFMGSMLGLVISGNVITLYIFWALTSLSSFLLIGFYTSKTEARVAAFQALLITELGGLSLLAGFILIGKVVGGYEMEDILNHHEILIRHPYYIPILILILLGAFTKSAQVPFHFWLPAAMQAPTPVSAYLHSATMVKAGIYLLLRLSPALGNTELWRTLLVVFGSITMFSGVYLSLSQKDLKGILAYVTVSSLGLMILFTGLGTVRALKAAILYLFVHALFKGALFMVAGTIDEKTGTRDIRFIPAIARKMKITTTVAFLALISMAGLPPLLGYISKELIYEAVTHTSRSTILILVITFLSNAMMFFVSAWIAYEVFIRKKKHPQEKEVKEAGFSFVFGPALLGVLGLILALFPENFEPLLKMAVVSVAEITPQIDLRLWHGINPVFILSLFTIATGVLLFIIRKAFLFLEERISRTFLPYNFFDLFNRFVEVSLSYAKKVTGLIQSGILRIYLAIVLIAAGSLIWYVLFKDFHYGNFRGDSPFLFYIAGISFLIAFSAVAAALTRTKLVAIVTMGVVGFGISLIYMFYGAPDLAITQVLVETLTLVLFVLVVYKLPQFDFFSPVKVRIRDAVIGIFIGAAMTGLVLKARITSEGEKVSGYMIRNSYPEAHGKDVVNVILVDFRAFDTIGEITVLILASIGIISLIKFKREKIG